MTTRNPQYFGRDGAPGGRKKSSARPRGAIKDTPLAYEEWGRAELQEEKEMKMKGRFYCRGGKEDPPFPPFFPPLHVRPEWRKRESIFLDVDFCLEIGWSDFFDSLKRIIVKGHLVITNENRRGWLIKLEENVGEKHSIF